MQILVFFLVLSILVLVHEAGHFLAAKLVDVKVEEFGFGLPPRIFGVKKGETLYSINALPIGGFVRLFGEDGMAEDKSEIDRAFFRKKPLFKLFIVTAGVVMNFLLATAIISYIFSQGVFIVSNKVFIEKVLKNSPAASAGLKNGDQIFRVDDQEIKYTEDLLKATEKNKGRETSFEIKRRFCQDKKESQAEDIRLCQRYTTSIFTVQMVPRVSPPPEEGALGIAISNFDYKKFAFWEAPIYGTVETAKMSYLTAKGIIELVPKLFSFSGVPKEVAGPIGIAKLVGEASKSGLMAVLQLMGVLSLNLAVINILPFPALDGGRLIFVLLEVIARKKLNPKIEATINTAGFIILLTLIAIVTRHDLIK